MTRPTLPSTDYLRVDLHVLPGEWLGLIGASGSGRSTMLRLLSQLLAPFGSVVRLDGYRMRDSNLVEAAQSFGLSAAQLTSATGLTVWEIVALATPAGGLTVWDQAAVNRALALARISTLADRLAEPLHGAERQRVFFAMALIAQPRVLLIDEPTAGLDVREQLALLEWLASLKRTENLAVVTVFDDLNLAVRYCERLSLLDHGRPILCGTPLEVLNSRCLEQVMGVEFQLIETPIGIQLCPLRIAPQ